MFVFVVSPLWIALVAAGPGVSVDWTAPDECPAQTSFVAQVEARLKQPLTGPFARAFRFRIDVAHVAEGYRLTLREGASERVLTHVDCEELTRAAALAVVLAVDPGALMRTTVTAIPVAPPPDEPRRPRAKKTTSTPTVAQPALKPRWEPEPPEEPEVPEFLGEPAGRRRVKPSPPEISVPATAAGAVAPRLAFRAEAGGAWAALPSAGVAVGITGAVVSDIMRFELTGRYRAPRSAVVSGSGVTVSMFSAVGRTCPVLHLNDSMELPICLGAEGGRVATDLAGGQSQISLYAAAQAGLHFVWMFNDWLGWWTAAEGSVAIVNYTVELASSTYSHGRFGGSGATGLELRVP